MCQDHAHSRQDHAHSRSPPFSFILPRACFVFVVAGYGNDDQRSRPTAAPYLPNGCLLLARTAHTNSAFSLIPGLASK